MPAAEVKAELSTACRMSLWTMPSGSALKKAVSVSFAPDQPPSMSSMFGASREPVYTRFGVERHKK
ncbi:MAG: hypothetical protein PHX68_01190 [Alphaproteobacteria bacterium]|nr:hypothetical protein [Alphaproteobacteria bacterium]